MHFEDSFVSYVNFEDADLRLANFNGAYMTNANLQRAYLYAANLQGAKNLTVAQLLEAELDDTTLLDPELRAEYERLKTEQGE